MQLSSLSNFRRNPFSMSSHCPSPWQPWSLISVCGSASSGRFPSMESHPVCPSVSVSLTEDRVLRVHLCCSECQCFSLFHGQVIFGYVEGQYCLSIIHWWALGLFLLKKNYFWLCWVFVAAHRLSLVVASRDYSLIAVRGLFIMVILLLWSTGSRTCRLKYLQHTASVDGA